MKFVSPFEPLSFWAQGPWVFFNMGLKFMQTWQDECFSRLSLVVPAVGKPLARNGAKPEPTLCEIQLLKNEIAATQGRQMPLLGCLQGVQVVGGPVAEETVLATPVAAQIEESPAIESAAAAPSVTSMLALQAKSLAKAVKVAPAPAVDKKSAAKKAAKPVAKAVASAPVKAAAKPAAVAKAAQKAKPAVSAKPAAKAKPVASKKA